MTNGFNPLNDIQRSALNNLINELSKEQEIWLHGFFEGRLSLSGISQSLPVSKPETVEPIANMTILYGSETGHSHELADKLAEKAANKNIAAKVINMYDYNVEILGEEENIAIIVSTHGEGDPPDMAEDFYKFVTGNRAPEFK